METVLPTAMRPPKAAAYLDTTEQSLAHMRHLGSGPVFVKAGRVVLYLREDLDAWLRSNRRRSTSDSGVHAMAAA
jgi:hypothetical protein